jgi:hypothetical protein
VSQLRRLVQAAKAWERAHVLPHCAVCSAPCCALETVVLDLDWPRVQKLYKIGKNQRAFDAALPPMLKKQGDLYYAHKAPCPAYQDKKCTVYDSALKPPSCSDFPIYRDGDAVTADRRCEAVDVDALERALSAVAPVRRQVNDAHPVFVSFVPVTR